MMIRSPARADAPPDDLGQAIVGQAHALAELMSLLEDRRVDERHDARRDDDSLARAAPVAGHEDL